MGVKRAAPESESPAKIRKQDAEYAPVVDALARVSDLAVSTCHMLQAALPHALGTPQPDRHAYQASVVDHVRELLHSEMTLRRDSVKAIEASVEAYEAEHGKHAADVAALKEMAATKMAARAPFEVAEKEAEQLVSVKRAEVEAALEKEKSLSVELGETSQKKEEIDKALADLWEPLKTASFQGREWRKRDKVTKEALALVEQLGAPASLLSGLPVALKAKLEDRGKFAVAAIEHGEAVFRDRLAALGEKLAGAELEKEARAKAVADAQGALKAAESAQKTAIQASIDAENAWVEEESRVNEAKEKAKAASDQSKDAQKKLEKAKAAVEAFGAPLALFDKMSSTAVAPETQATAAAPAEVPAEEAPASAPTAP